VDLGELPVEVVEESVYLGHVSPSLVGEPLAVRTETAQTSALAPGTIVGEYRVRTSRARVAWAWSNAGVHPEIGKRVAIKVLGALRFLPLS
jgi:hypothetical protein